MYGGTSEDKFTDTSVFLHVAQLCEYCQESRWLRSIQWMAAFSPMKLGACPPFFNLFVGDGMFGSLSLAYDASPLPSLAPPLRGDLISRHTWIRDRG